MTKELKEDLESINFGKYIEIFESHGLNDFSDLEYLTDSDYERFGILDYDDRKKLVRLYGKQETRVEVKTVEVVSPREDSYQSHQQYREPTPQPIIINSSEHSSHTGIAGVLGGVIGAVAVIVIILLILSNESFSL